MQTAQPNGRNRSYDQINPSYNNDPGQQNDLMSYSFKICTIFGIPIHVHWLLPAFFVLSFIFWARIIADDSSHFWYYVLLILLYNFVLWETVLIHELGHCFAGWLVGGTSEKVLLWPLGGLAFTKPPLNTDMFPARCNDRISQIIIALGGPLTHIPHMAFWGYLLYWNGKYNQHAGVIIDNPFTIEQTWNQTIFVPITEWLDYDFFMLAFTLNFWLFIVNLFLPAFPLDGSRIFVNALRTKFGIRTVAQIYVGANGVLGVGFILLAYVWLKNGSMCQFAGIWAIYQVHVMVQFIIQGREFAHPLLQEN